MRKSLMSWTTARKASFGALMMSLWREQRVQDMSRMSPMRNVPPLHLSSPYLPSENSAGDGIVYFFNTLYKASFYNAL